MDAAGLWLLRILDAGPESYFLLVALSALAWFVRGQMITLKGDVADLKKAHKKDVDSLRDSQTVEVRLLQNRINAEIKSLYKVRETSDKEHRGDLKMSQALFESHIERLKYTIAQLEKIVFGQSIAIQTMGGPKLIVQSANGSGDFLPNIEIHTEAKA